MATKARSKSFNIKVPVAGAEGYRATGVIHFKNVTFEGRKYGLIMIPVDGISPLQPGRKNR